MQIGQLAKACGFSAAAIRHYEAQGLLPKPVRGENAYRQYDPSVLGRLKFIRSCRSLDFSLDEIRLLLAASDAPTQSCALAHTTLDAHVQHVSERIAQLEQLRTSLVEMRQRCGLDSASEPSDRNKTPDAECASLQPLRADLVSTALLTQSAPPRHV